MLKNKENKLRPEDTHKLEIKLLEKNETTLLDLKEFLSSLGIKSYCEGDLDSLESLTDEECQKKMDELLDDTYVADKIILHSYYEDELLKHGKAVQKNFNNKVTTIFSSIKTSSWLDKWKESFKPIETKSYIVFPPWETKSIEGNKKKKIIIEPALAFGTGQHESTQICLRLLESYLTKIDDKSSLRALDLGTGSGILAIAAAKEGITQIDAIDIEEDSVRAAKTNASLNSVDFFVVKSNLTHFKKNEEKKKYNLILANILLPVLVQSLPEFPSITAEDSQVILSGLITSQREEMLQACTASNFELIEEITQGDWLGLRVKKANK